MKISRLMPHAHKVEGGKLREHDNENKNDRTWNYYFF